MRKPTPLSAAGSPGTPSELLDKWAKTPSPNPRYGGMTPEQAVRVLLKPEEKPEGRQTP